MKKIAIFSTFIIFLLTGCGYSNWNILSPNSPNDVVLKEPTKKPKKVEEVKKEEKKPEEPKQQEVKDRKNSFTIDQVIKSWGPYDLKRTSNSGNPIYIWKNCKTTGKTKTQCNGDTCDTVQETTCCERALRVDSEGYVTNLKEAIASCM